MRAAAAAVPGVATVEKCRVRKMGLDFYVDLHIGVDGLLTVAAGHQIAHEVKDGCESPKAGWPMCWSHIEPDNVCPYPGRRPS